VSAFVIGILPLLSEIYKMIEDDTFSVIRDDLKTLAAKLDATLPQKANGPWMPDEVHAAAAVARQPWMQALATVGQTR
jgi:hypothetical protein